MLRLIVAGILAIPSLVTSLVASVIIAVLSIPSTFLLLFRKKQGSASSSSSSTCSLPERYHVIITGGSSGIGLSIAHNCVIRQDVDQVTILARNPKRLQDAKALLESYQSSKFSSSSNTKSTTTATTTDKSSGTSSSTKKPPIIQAKSVSVSDPKALEDLAKELCGAGSTASNKSTTRPSTIVLFQCAGTSHTTYHDMISTEKMMELVQTNQLGVMYTTKAFLPYMLGTANDDNNSNKNSAMPRGGRIIITSSAAGQVGVFGYSAYSPTKYALRGYAEALHAELVPYPNVHVQLAFPADTNTPGYEKELELMPPVTKALNESAGLADPNETAQVMIRQALKPNPKFLVYFNLEGWMLSNLTAGMTPVSSLDDALTQVAFSSLLRFISLFYLNDWWNIIHKHHTLPNYNDDNEKDSSKSRKDFKTTRTTTTTTTTTSSPSSYGSIDKTESNGSTEDKSK